MKRTRETKKTVEKATDGIDFNTPTPRRLRRKMVKWQDVVLRLMREFPKADVGYTRPLAPLSRRSLLDCPPIIAAFECEGAVYRRERQLKKLAYFRNADIKFGFRRGKAGWWQDAAA